MRTLLDTGTGPLVLNARTAEFVRSLGYLILAKVDLAAARRLKVRKAPGEGRPMKPATGIDNGARGHD
jgi:hypothetical protein